MMMMLLQETLKIAIEVPTGFAWMGSVGIQDVGSCSKHMQDVAILAQASLAREA